MLKNIIKVLLPWKNRSEKIYKLYQKSRFFHLRRMNEIANYYSYKIYKKYKCEIHGSATIGNNFSLPHPIGVIIGSDVKIGNNVTLYQNVTLGRKYKDDVSNPEIGDNTIIYANSVIVGSVKIGKNCIIGCNSVVLKDVPDNSTVNGVIK